MTEAEARDWAEQNGRRITVKVQEYSDVAYGWAMEDTTGSASSSRTPIPAGCSAPTSWARRPPP
jgi:D-serine dehydratase